KLEDWRPRPWNRDADSLILEAVKEVGRTAFFALVIMAVAFLPVLALEGEEGRLFHPLAYAKSLTMLVAAVSAISPDPALRITMARLGRFDWGRGQCARWINAALGARVCPEEQNPLSRTLIRIYQPTLQYTLRHKALVVAAVLIAAAATV